MEKPLISLNNNNKIRQKQKRSKEIDIIKCFSCFGVVYIHCSFPDLIGKIIEAINRYAVPFFFFVSGYYFLNYNMFINNTRLINKIKHLLLLLKKSGLFYFIFCILFNNLKNRKLSMILYTKSLINKKSIIRFIILNRPFLYLHIWFILALLYCYLFMFLLFNLNSNLITNSIFVYFFVIFGIIGYHLLTEFRNIKLINFFLSYLKFKNNIAHIFFFRALPFFMIGIIVRKNKIKPIKPFYQVFSFIFGSILASVEMILFKVSLNSYIGTYFQLISLVSFCLMEKYNNNKFFEITSFVGRELSDNIYIYHIAVKNAIFLLLYKMNIIPQRWFLYFRYFLVLLMSIIFSYLMKVLTIKKFKLTI